MKEERKFFASFDSSLNAIEKDKKDKKKRIEECKIEQQQLKHSIQKITSELEMSIATVKNILSANPWIEDQKQ